MTRVKDHERHERRLSEAPLYHLSWEPEDVAELRRLMAEGYTAREMAERLDRTIGGVYSMIHRMRVRGEIAA